MKEGVRLMLSLREKNYFIKKKKEVELELGRALTRDEHLRLEVMVVEYFKRLPKSKSRYFRN